MRTKLITKRDGRGRITSCHEHKFYRISDFENAETIELFGIKFIELPPNTCIGSFTLPLSKAYKSVKEACKLLLHNQPLYAFDILLKTNWDGRWQFWGRRQIVGRHCTPSGSYAAKKPLGTGKYFIK